MRNRVLQRCRVTTPRFSSKRILFYSCGVVALILAMMMGVLWGSVSVSSSQVLQVIGHKIFNPHTPAADPLAETIIWTLRLPRVCAAALVGAALALAGATLQALVRNPLADPYTLGISNGASFMAVAAMSSISSLWIRNLGVPVAALLGAGLTLTFVLYLAQYRGTFTGSRIVLAGVGVGQVAMAGTSLIQLKSEPGEIRGILFWMLGSVSGVQSFDKLFLPTVILFCCTCFLIVKARSINILSLGDEDAYALGINVNIIRVQLIIVVAILTGMAVSIAGGVGFIGLIIPHSVRFFTGSDYRRVLPACVLVGAISLVLIDLFSRMIDTPNEYPLTIFTAALGGPFFLWLLKKNAAGGMV